MYRKVKEIKKELIEIKEVLSDIQNILNEIPQSAFEKLDLKNSIIYGLNQKFAKGKERNREWHKTFNILIISVAVIIVAFAFIFIFNPNVLFRLLLWRLL